MYICVLDFEATCDDEPKYGHEIIEFPSVLYRWDQETNEFKYISEFQEYCKPKKKPILTKFCTNLTGITQDQVDTGDDVINVMVRHYDWIKDKTNYIDDEFYFVTCGKWDLDVMLPTDLSKRNVINYPKIYKKYLNIKDQFSHVTGHFKGFGMKRMLEYFEMKIIGRHHCGLDDCKNTAYLFGRLIHEGLKFENQFVRYHDYKLPNKIGKKIKKGNGVIIPS
jgi:inhibitor of KinA sporulation pathway (predicted exonuclease)